MNKQNKKNCLLGLPIKLKENNEDEKRNTIEHYM